MHGNGRNATHSPPPQQPEPQQQRFFAQHDFDGSADLTTTLVHAISNVTGADVTEAEHSLENHVNARALNRLFSPQPDGTPRGGAQLNFTLWGHQVTVYGDGQITIVPCQQPPVGQG